MAAAAAHSVGEMLEGLAAGTPRVEAKEVEGLTLLQRRRGLARLDLGPFALAYAVATLGLLAYAISGHWWVGRRR